MILSRRGFCKAALVGIPAFHSLTLATSGNASSDINGVQLGVQTYSFHEITKGGMGAVDAVIRDMRSVGLPMCELFSPDIEPFAMPWFAVDAWKPGAPRETGPAGDVNAAMQKYIALEKSPEVQKQRKVLREWRLSTPLSYFSGVAQKFTDAGIKIFCYNLSFDDTFTDEEIDRGFEIAKALGTNIITASSPISTAKRLVPFMEKHRTYVAVHGHSDVKDPEQFSSPETFREALKLSEYFKINLDIGHFWAAGFDPVPYIEQQHENISNLHLKNRLPHDGANVPWAEGRDQTPIRQVLLLLREKRWPIPAFIEYEYQGEGTPEQEVAKNVAYCKKVLAS